MKKIRTCFARISSSESMHDGEQWVLPYIRKQLQRRRYRSDYDLLLKKLHQLFRTFYYSPKMPLIVESCSKEELAAGVGGSEELLIELRDKLSDWLKLQPHLPHDAAIETLEWFILGSKMSLEKAKQKLDMYYTIRRLVPELFANRDPLGRGLSTLHEIMEYAMLPRYTPEKYNVHIFRPIVNESSKFDPWELFKYTFMVGDIKVQEFHSIGEVYVYDLTMLSMGHLLKLTPTLLKKCDITYRNAYAARLRGLHYINAPPFVDHFVTMVKSILSPKIAARVHVHAAGDMESFYKFIPRSMLPKDYGGDERPMNELSALMREKVCKRRDWFIQQEKVMVDERLRPGPAFDKDSLFGFSGSFRKLDVD